MKKCVKIVLWILVLAGVGGGLWWGFGAKGLAGGGTKVHHKTATIESGDIAQTVTANGSLDAVQTVEVGSEVSGKIVELFADYNSAVTNGQVLARLDDSTYLRSKEQCEAELASAKASLKLAEANFERAKELRKEELLSKADYDSAEATWAQAKASLRQREASLEKAEVDVAKTVIYSPMDGMVLSRAVDVGQTVAASMTTPVLFTLAKDLREMRIEAEISEADVGGVEEQQEVVFTVDAYPECEFTGIVSQVRYEPVKTQNVVNYIAIVDVVNEGLQLRPGMTANASVVTAKRSNVLRLPNAALRFRPNEGEAVTGEPPAAGRGKTSSHSFERHSSGNFHHAADSSSRAPQSPAPPASNLKAVYVKEDDGLRQVFIETGITDGSWTEIVGGLNEGDEVITGRASSAADSAARDAKPAGSSSPFMPGPPRR